MDFRLTPAHDLCHNHGFATAWIYLAWDLAKRDAVGLPIPYVVWCHENESGEGSEYWYEDQREGALFDDWPETARWALVETKCDRAFVGDLELQAEVGLTPEDWMLANGLTSLHVLGWRGNDPTRFVVGHCQWNNVGRVEAGILYRLHNLPHPEYRATLTEWPAGMLFAPQNDLLVAGPLDGSRPRANP